MMKSMIFLTAFLASGISGGMNRSSTDPSVDYSTGVTINYKLLDAYTKSWTSDIEPNCFVSATVLQNQEERSVQLSRLSFQFALGYIDSSDGMLTYSYEKIYFEEEINSYLLQTFYTDNLAKLKVNGEDFFEFKASKTKDTEYECELRFCLFGYNYSKTQTFFISEENCYSTEQFEQYKTNRFYVSNHIKGNILRNENVIPQSFIDAHNDYFSSGFQEGFDKGYKEGMIKDCWWHALCDWFTDLWNSIVAGWNDVFGGGNK